MSEDVDDRRDDSSFEEGNIQLDAFLYDLIHSFDVYVRMNNPMIQT